jgi:Rieske Fe-S protein
VADDLERPGGDAEHEAPPHAASPSIWPFAFALGIAVALIGLVISWPIAAIGGAIALVFGFLWIRDATREVRGTPPPAPPARADEPEEVDEEGVARYPRSVFLEGATLGIGALIGAVVTVPALGFAVLPAFVDQEYDDVDLGTLDNFPEGQWLITKFQSVADEPGDVARRTAYVRNNGTQDGQPSFTIISNRCVHLGCPVQPQGLTEEETTEVEAESGLVELAATEPSGFVCPCHGGAYDIEGNRTAGPPVRALDRYAYSVVEGRLVLGQPYSVGHVEGTGSEAVIKAYEIADPGVHVDGLEQYFYPYVP